MIPRRELGIKSNGRITIRSVTKKEIIHVCSRHPKETVVGPTSLRLNNQHSVIHLTIIILIQELKEKVIRKGPKSKVA